MLPRFSNPHFLPQLIQTASRAEIYSSGNGDVPHCAKHDAEALEHLHRLLETSLPQYVGLSPDLDGKSKKRRRITVEQADITASEEPVCALFRLVSTSLPPLPVSLLPPPSPPSLTREPDAEDNEQQALIRKQRAEATAVDGATILDEARSLEIPRKPCINLRIPGNSEDSRIMIVRTLQQPRKTRPPVPPSKLLHFPYVADVGTILAEQTAQNSMGCRTLDAEIVESDGFSTQRPKRRRRRNLGPAKERPPPQFWRPDPKWRGKCMGYGYGYPSRLKAGVFPGIL